MHSGGVWWQVRSDLRDRFRLWLDGPFRGLFESGSLVKDTPGSRVAISEGWVVKLGTARRGRSRWRYGLRLSGARRAAILAERLLSAGVPTPRPVAWATVRAGLLRVREYLVTEEERGAMALTRRMAAMGPGEAERAGLARRYGALLGLFHAAGFSNRDLKDENILVRGDGGLVAIDMDGVTRCFRVPRARAARDFFAVTRSLALNGWGDTDTARAVLEGYISAAPARLRMDELPYAGRFSVGPGDSA